MLLGALEAFKTLELEETRRPDGARPPEVPRLPLVVTVVLLRELRTAPLTVAAALLAAPLVEAAALLAVLVLALAEADGDGAAGAPPTTAGAGGAMAFGGGGGSGVAGVPKSGPEHAHATLAAARPTAEIVSTERYNRRA